MQARTEYDDPPFDQPPEAFITALGLLLRAPATARHKTLAQVIAQDPLTLAAAKIMQQHGVPPEDVPLYMALLQTQRIATMMRNEAARQAKPKIAIARKMPTPSGN